MNIVILIIFVVVIIAFSIVAAITNTADFFSMNCSNTLTLLIAVVVTYFLNQKNQNYRRFYDSTVKILESIQKIVVNNFICSGFDKESITELQQQMRIVRNKLDVLKTVQDKLKIQTELTYLEQNFNNYKNLIDNHINDYNHLNNSNNDLNNYISLLDGKLTETIVKIYKLDL